MTTIAEPIAPAGGGSWTRTLLLAATVAFFAWQTPAPWGGLWVMVPGAVAVSLLTAWRWGARGVLAPVAIFALAMLGGGPFSLWVWWIPAAALTGTWMGLREEGGGLPAGERAWMMLPVLLLAVMLPWMVNYPALITELQGWLQRGDQQVLELYRQLGYQGERLQAMERSLSESAALRNRGLPYALPTLLFVWMAVLVALGRGLASRFARQLRWPELSHGHLADWRLPDAAIWLWLLGLALVVTGWSGWSTSAWTLLINLGLGYCLQGVAVVESLLRTRGISQTIVALTFVFVFVMAAPAFLLATICVGVSDVWLDYRRLEAVPDGDSS